jgi:hypothetical protein
MYNNLYPAANTHVLDFNQSKHGHYLVSETINSSLTRLCNYQSKEIFIYLFIWVFEISKVDMIWGMPCVLSSLAAKDILYIVRYQISILETLSEHGNLLMTFIYFFVRKFYSIL